MAELAKRVRIVGPERTKLARTLSKRYAKGATIRQLADEYGRSYGFVHRLLVEDGNTMRSRGGSRTGRRG